MEMREKGENEGDKGEKKKENGGESEKKMEVRQGRE